MRRAVGVAFLGAALGACVLADPPATLPPVEPGPPQIVVTSVVPASDATLVEWPNADTFVVPVYLPDPTREVLWRAFINYSPVESNPVIYSNSQPANTANSESITTIDVTLGDRPIGLGCFTVTIVVAYGWSTNVSAPSAPDAEGGSSVTWHYAPSGGVCLGYDAGALNDATFPDAGDGGAL
jgi:hypothetical protein